MLRAIFIYFWLNFDKASYNFFFLLSASKKNVVWGKSVISLCLCGDDKNLRESFESGRGMIKNG